MDRVSVSLLATRGLPLGAKGKWYSTYVCSVMLYGSEHTKEGGGRDGFGESGLVGLVG